MKKRFCQKVSYNNIDQAKEARKTLQYRQNKFFNAKVYQCPNCRKYHLTTTGY